MSAKITGHYELIYPSKYLKACDLRGKDVTVQIDHVTWENLVMAGGKKDKKAAIHMRNPATGKPLSKLWIAGKTVLKGIVAATGHTDVAKWAGCKVTMYPTTCNGQKGEIVECVRVRVRTTANAASPTDDMMAEPDAPAEPEDEFATMGAGDATSDAEPPNAPNPNDDGRG